MLAYLCPGGLSPREHASLGPSSQKFALSTNDPLEMFIRLNRIVDNHPAAQIVQDVTHYALCGSRYLVLLRRESLYRFIYIALPLLERSHLHLSFKLQFSY